MKTATIFNLDGEVRIICEDSSHGCTCIRLRNSIDVTDVIFRVMRRGYNIKTTKTNKMAEYIARYEDYSEACFEAPSDTMAIRYAKSAAPWNDGYGIGQWSFGGEGSVPLESVVRLVDGEEEKIY